MALPIQKQTQYWGIFALIFCLILWFLGDILMPFLVGSAIAYFLDPVADRLENMGLSRVLATTVITVVAVLAFVVMILLVIPNLISQTSLLITEMPQIFQSVRDWLGKHAPNLLVESSILHEQLAKLGEFMKSHIGGFLTALLGSANKVMGMIMFALVVPVVTIYMLLDWDNMIAKIDTLLPRDHAPMIRQLAKDVDSTLAGFIRGQGSVCLILGTFYAIGLMVIGLKYGLLIGLIAGLISFIPYVGALFGGGLALGLALFQFWGDWSMIAAVGAVFAIGQVLEGNILTPRLVGGSVGLHPVWLLLALSVFGSVFGFVGMLVAVPISAVIGVLTRFFISQYTQGRLYQGLDHNLPATTEDEQ